MGWLNLDRYLTLLPTHPHGEEFQIVKKKQYIRNSINIVIKYDVNDILGDPFLSIINILYWMA